MAWRARELGRPCRPAGILRIILPAAILFSASCIVSPILTPPAKIQSLEGYGSASLRGEAGISKAKISFVFELPRRGRVEALDVLGRTMYFILFADKGSYLVIPSKKIFSEASSETMMDRLFGLDFSPEEIICLLSGRWGNGNGGAGADYPAGWVLDRGDGGSVRAGTKGGFHFEIIEFNRGLAVPRTISFSRPPNAGRIKITSLWFNRPLRPKAFDMDFLNRYQSKAWPEMERLLRNED